MNKDYSSILKPFRTKIDSLDKELVELLARREKIIHEVADVKIANHIPAVLQARVDEVRENAVAMGKELGADENYIREIYTTLIRLSCEIEEEKAKQQS